jgi:hypothetical protein
VTIEDNQGNLVPLTLNPPQRKSAAVRERQRRHGKPIRQLELKHRQYGSTTEKNAYVAWHQNVLHRRWNAYVISLDQGGAREIVARYDRIAKHYPPQMGQITLRPYYGAQNTKLIPERECFLAIGSAKRPNAPSGRTIQGALISEAGKMKSTNAQGADKLMTNITSMVQLQPETLLLVESTAEESGVWFREEVAKARRGDSNYAFTFISVFDDPRCQLDVTGDPDIDVREWIRRWDEDAERMWSMGATLGQIRWYQVKERSYRQPWQMKQENPRDPDEAFQTGAKRVFRPTYVNAMRETCRPAKKRGELMGAGQTGELALTDVSFEPEPRGRLRIWREPGDTYGGLLENGVQYRNRYAVASDVGPGQSKDADYSVTGVLDRAPRVFGGHPEIVAVWRGHEDADLYAWKAAQLAAWYEWAYWAIEVNSYEWRPKAEKDADFGVAVVDEVKEVYPNLYHREVHDNVNDKTYRKVGWRTTADSKPVMIKALQRRLRSVHQARQGNDPGGPIYVERFEEACNEMDTFVTKGGTMQAMDGKKDDIVVVDALLCHLDDEMPPVRKRQRKDRPQAKPSSAAAL